MSWLFHFELAHISIHWFIFNIWSFVSLLVCTLRIQWLICTVIIERSFAYATSRFRGAWCNELVSMLRFCSILYYTNNIMLIFLFCCFNHNLYIVKFLLSNKIHWESSFSVAIFRHRQLHICIHCILRDELYFKISDGIASSVQVHGQFMHYHKQWAQ